MTPSEKRNLYFAQNPFVYQLYRQIKDINNSSDGCEDLLLDIKRYAVEHTKFYRDYSPNDVFPIMTKLDFIRHKDEICSDEVFDKPIHTSSTSGSTGVPFCVTQNWEKRMRTIADLKVFGEYALYPSHEKMLQLRAYHGKELDRSVDERENIWRYDITNLSDADIENLIDFIQEWKPYNIFGYTSTMETISDYILKTGREYDFGCKSILVGATALTDEIAQKIMSVFHCPVFDRYSNMEMGIYAQREYGKTNFIINKASYYFEVVKLDRDEPAEEHEIGRLVFTDLFNHAFPMIRYDTGDLGSYCMNGNNKELEKVYGRRVDSVYDANGNLLSPHGISTSMWGIQGIEQWQFIQKSKSEYTIRVIASGDIGEDELLARFKKLLGDTSTVNVEYVADIPVLSSQKRKYIINEMYKT